MRIYSPADDGLKCTTDRCGYFFIEDTFGVQVFMIALGYLIITRLNLVISRWDDACTSIKLMSTTKLALTLR